MSGTDQEVPKGPTNKHIKVIFPRDDLSTNLSLLYIGLLVLESALLKKKKYHQDFKSVFV